MKNILVVDDDEEIRDAVAACLELEGYAVVTARNGAEALDQVNEPGRTFDLIMTDLRMPVMDGTNLIRRLRENTATRWVPCVVLTAETGKPQDPFVRYLKKPFDIGQLVHVVEETFSVQEAFFASPFAETALPPRGE